MIVHSLFSYPVFEIKTDIDLEKLKPLIEKRREKDAGVEQSNSGGWHSGNICKDESFFEFTNNLSSIVSESLRTILKEDRVLSLQNCWININGNGHYNHSHVHPMSVISGVFYVDAEKSSPIVFENVNYYSQFYLIECLNEKFKNDFGVLLDASYIPINGTILLFPSTLHHHVEQNMSVKNRISISFNFNIFTST